MSEVLATISMLHEPVGRHSAVRMFRGEPVLAWTLRRLGLARSIKAIAVLCWDDQRQLVEHCGQNLAVMSKGPRRSQPVLEALGAAGRWSDGWRGGLLQTCHFDCGFHGPWIHELAVDQGAGAVILIDPSAAIVDPGLIDGLVEHAQAHEQIEMCFMPAAPGFGAALIRMTLLERLASASQHPGRLLHYRPEEPGRDAISTEACAPIPTAVARTLHRFTFDSDRQIARLDRATESLNGQLLCAGAEDLVGRVAALADSEELPREVVLELTVRRSTRPIFSPVAHLQLNRPDLSLDAAISLFAELAEADDMRLTLGGVGDPLLHPQVLEIVAAATAAGINAIQVQTDLHEVEAYLVSALVESGVDVISIHLPAATAAVYRQIMGIDGYARVIENIKQLVLHRQKLSRGLPLAVPIFVKCRENLAEMEQWYDQWLRALGSAVIAGPSDFAGQIPDCAVADMSPPRRHACRRLNRRMTVLSDGRIVACEQDCLGRQVLGRIGIDPIARVWQQEFAAMRRKHAQSNWEYHPLCRSCREWHRP